MSGTRNKIEDLRNHLFETLEALKVAEAIRSCPNGMCGHCIELLCEELMPELEGTVALREGKEPGE